MKKVFIYSNDTKVSESVRQALLSNLQQKNFEISNVLSHDVDLIFCVGGDGALLNLMQNHQFPTIPICGINAGHLGFFQAVVPEEIDKFLDDFLAGNVSTLAYNIVKATVETESGIIEHRALNEFALKRSSSHAVHFNLSINNAFIEKFSGDGICIASPAGSTGYNYSLGGAIVDPRLNLLQATPISPMNSVAFRSLTSSILLPAKDKLVIEPEDDFSKILILQFDGREIAYKNVKKVTFTLSSRKINLVRFSDSKFWEVVKEKFL